MVCKYIVYSHWLVVMCISICKIFLFINFFSLYEVHTQFFKFYIFACIILFSSSSNKNFVIDMWRKVDFSKTKLVLFSMNWKKRKKKNWMFTANHKLQKLNMRLTHKFIGFGRAVMFSIMSVICHFLFRMLCSLWNFLRHVMLFISWR